jgi:cell division protein ZapD
VTQGNTIVSFEQPLTERVRTFLRLEFLFGLYKHYRADASEAGARASLQALLEILTVLSRADLKNEVLKELSDQHATLTKLIARPGVDTTRLNEVLGELALALNGMQQLATQFAATLLRGNDFLISLHNRTGIPGGTCGFDLPLYHLWLSQPYELIKRGLDAWYADVRPFENAITLYLRLLRNSVKPKSHVARSGMFVDVPQPACVLLRVDVLLELRTYPEISAGKHRFTVRFMKAGDVNSRSQQCSDDISFQMQCCAL